MTKFKFISILALSAAMALPATAGPSRIPITVAHIAAAISESGMKVTPQQITLLTQVVATNGNPALRVESMERWGDQRMRARLDCASSEECLPFLVAVRLDSESPAQSTAASTDSAPTASARTRPDPKSFVVHGGSAAVLLLDGDHVHIQLNVICLENGVKGQTVRVTSNDHRETYSAEVVDGSLLKGKL